MNILLIIIVAFIVLELSNEVLLYFFPQSKKGNGVGVFNAYEKSKQDPEVHRLVKYLVNWVAGTKLIFIALLIVILITGDSTTRYYCMVALVLSISTFYWRLYPIIREMDKNNELTPSGYSKTLGYMIGGFISLFILSLILSELNLF